MADFYDELIAQGLLTPSMDISTIQDGVEAEMQYVFGADIDLSPETPQGRLVEVLTAERAGVLGFCAANANQLNPAYSTGLFLDAVASIFFLTRIGATSTRVLADITGTSGTVIPAGSLAKTTAGDIFYAENAITIPVGGTTTGYFLSQEKGAIPCETGTLTTIVGSVFGWTSIVDSGSLTIGLEQESDNALWIRIQASRYTGSGLLEDIKSNLQSVSNLVSSFVYDNGTDTPDTTTITGVTIAPHSIIVVADGGVDADIAQAVYARKSAGCDYTAILGEGTITFSDVGTDGQTVTVAGTVYTLKSTPAASYDVQIGGSANATAVSLCHAINADGTEGVDYFAGTLINPLASGAITGTGEITVTGGQYGQTILSTDDEDVTVDITTAPQNVTVVVEDGAYGSSYPVTFNRPEEIQIDVEITVKTETYSGSDLEADVKTAITDWANGEITQVDGLKIGRSVSPFEIASAVSIQIPAIYVKSVTICEHGGSPATTEIDITQAQVARIETANIKVKVI